MSIFLAQLQIQQNMKYDLKMMQTVSFKNLILLSERNVFQSKRSNDALN